MNIILWVKLMIKKYTNIKKIILPSKKINLFVISVLFLGVIAGGIFVNLIGMNDRNLVIDKIKMFIENIEGNNLDTILVFKNSISINLVYTFIIWILGMSLIGILFNILLLFLKGFIFGFSIASFIMVYGVKGIILSFLYLMFGQILNIITIMLLSIYSIMFSIKLLRLIFKKSKDGQVLIFFKNYIIILASCIIISLISSVCETFLLPSMIKLVVKLFI